MLNLFQHLQSDSIRLHFLQIQSCDMEEASTYLPIKTTMSYMLDVTFYFYFRQIPPMTGHTNSYFVVHKS